MNEVKLNEPYTEEDPFPLISIISFSPKANKGKQNTSKMVESKPFQDSN
jgi:hypothetical protein